MGMKFISCAAMALALSSTAYAGDKVAKAVEHKGIMTERLGERVPTMTNNNDPKATPTSGGHQTYTDAVGNAVPTMTAPEPGRAQPQ